MQTMAGLKDQALLESLTRSILSKHPKYIILLNLGIQTGLRISDILKIKSKNITGVNFGVTESKTKKRRQLTITDELFNAIQTHKNRSNLRPDDFLIYSSEKKHDRPLSRVQAYRVISKIGKEIAPGVPIGTHSMRKTFAIGLFRMLGSVEEVQKVLGHKYPSTTLRYLGTPDELAKALLS
jgi:integrase